MVNCLTLDGSIRKDLGSANTNRLRKEGFLPAVIYGNKGEENIYISVVKKDFNKEYAKGGIQTKPIELTVDGKKYNVLTYQIDIDPVFDTPRHIDFINLEGKKEVKVCIPVNFIGKEKSPGLKRGGYLNVLKRKIQCYVNPSKIPATIDINISGIHIGDKLKIQDIELSSELKVVDKSNFNVCTVTGRGKSRISPAEEAVAAEAPAKAPAKKK